MEAKEAKQMPYDWNYRLRAEVEPEWEKGQNGGNG